MGQGESWKVNAECPVVSGECRVVRVSGEGEGELMLCPGVSASRRALPQCVKRAQARWPSTHHRPQSTKRQGCLAVAGCTWATAGWLTPFSRPQAACAGGTRSRAQARLTRGTLSTRERSARRAGQRQRPAVATSSIGAERHVPLRPMQVRLMFAGRVHASRQEGCVPCSKGDATRRREAARAPQVRACCLPLAPCDRSGWQELGRPIRRDGRVAGRALYRRAAGSGRSR